jgi:hypothetical protein
MGCAQSTAAKVKQQHLPEQSSPQSPPTALASVPQASRDIFLVGCTPDHANSTLLARYIHTSEQFGGRPVYVHENKPDTFLHYSIGRWYIGPKVGEWVGSLFVESSAQTPDLIHGGGSTSSSSESSSSDDDEEAVSPPSLVHGSSWSVWRDGTWLAAPELRCVRTDPLADAHDTVFVRGRTPTGKNAFRAFGEYSRSADQFQSRWVYKRISGGRDMYIFFACGAWWVGEKLPTGTKVGGWLRAKASAWLPEQAGHLPWHMVFGGKWRRATEVSCSPVTKTPPDVHKDGRWIDQDFPPAPDSVGPQGSKHVTAVNCWLRSDYLATREFDRGHGGDDASTRASIDTMEKRGGTTRAREQTLKSTHSMLFKGVTPDDLLQGSVGDCWLMASLACVAE